MENVIENKAIMKKILNILLGILMAITVVLLVYAIATGGSDAAISLNLVWGYFLFVFAVAAALFCAIFGMIQNPAGIKGTILSLALIIIVVGVSYFYAAGHTVNIVDLQTNGFFGHGNYRNEHSRDVRCFRRRFPDGRSNRNLGRFQIME